MVDLPDKQSAFIDWYLAVVEEAGLSDKRYPVKGMNVWTPYGFLARRNLDTIVLRELERAGAHPVEFPLLIPETEFRKEREHIKGFDEQVYWVTRGGSTPLDIPLVLRPTSETAMYPVFALWVRSHRDLPLNVYQVVNTFRYETKTTRPFIRVREIHFYEEHTCQSDEADATERVQTNLASFQAMAEALALPYLALRRPEWDKFPGAFYTVGLDQPIGGARTLQLGSIHHYRENFSRPYGIQYEAPDGATHFVHQTTFGLSERLVGAVIAAHGDQKGVVFPSELAPYEVVIVPIVAQATAARVTEAVESLTRRLETRQFRVHLDQSDERPGAKYYHWETLGVPLRVEVGAREVESGTLVTVDRLGRREPISLADAEEGLRRRLREFDTELRTRAQSAFSKSLVPANTLEALRNSNAVRLVPWCGSEKCGHAIEEAIEGAVLGTPETPLPVALDEPGPCVGCGVTQKIQWTVAAQPV